jgi:hypothetical protein
VSKKVAGWTLTAGRFVRLTYMKRPFYTRSRLLGVLLLVALAGFFQTTGGRACGVYCHSEFRKYFEGLGTGETRVNPVERVLFSVLLSTTRSDRPEPQPARLQAVPAKHL